VLNSNLIFVMLFKQFIWFKYHAYWNELCFCWYLVHS